MNDLKKLAGLFDVLLLVAGNLLFKDHYCIFPTVKHPPDNVKLLQKQLSNDEAAVPVQNHRRGEEKRI